MSVRTRLEEPESKVVLAFVALCGVALLWGLPGSESWAPDSVSPRASGLGAIVESYIPGHYHRYPPLHLLVLTFLALPVIAIAGIKGGSFEAGPLEALLITPAYMTPLEIIARVVAIAMAAAIVAHTMRLFTRLADRRVGIAAGVCVALNPVFVYYAVVGNLEVPSLFWATWGLVEVERLLRGEPRLMAAALKIAAAVLTKDQTAGIFVLVIPICAVVLYRTQRPVLAQAWRAVLASVLFYGLASGALVNPTGFRTRLSVLFGPASQDWAQYPKGVMGALQATRDALFSTPQFTSWPLAACVVVGIVLCLLQKKDRLRRALPLLGALSYTLLFTFGARRTEPRFLLPQAILLLPYAAFLIEKKADLVRRGALALGWAIAAIGVVSMQATKLGDARYEAERFLSNLSEGTAIEVIGGPKFLPRIPATLNANRPGKDLVVDRSHLPNVKEIYDPEMDPTSRAPEYIVLSTEFSDEGARFSGAGGAIFEVSAYNDEATRRFFTRLMDGSLGYERVLEAKCRLPAPLDCRHIHGGTGGSVWIYRRASRP